MTTNRSDATLRRELPNLRAAWGLARHREDLDAAVTMATGLFDAVADRDLVELRGWVADLAADPALTEHHGAAAVFGVAAEAAYHRGDLDEARRLNDLGLAGARSPSMRSWGAYVAGEIDSLSGRHDDAAQRYLEALELARVWGATFLHGVATVGLLAVRSRGPQPRAALAGYRETIDYFARTGHWTHLWATLRDLADLLRRLGDAEPAARLESAADRAPGAPRSPARSPSPHREGSARRRRTCVRGVIARPRDPARAPDTRGSATGPGRT